MTFIEWLSENQGWFLMYLFMGIFIASIFFDKFPGIPTLSYNNTNTLFASMWLLG